MKRLNLTSIAFIATLTALSSPLAQAAGYQTTKLKVEHRDGPLPLHVWYPSQEDGVLKSIGKNIVFKGVKVRIGAKAKAGKFPLVVLSHGSGGNAVNIAWIGAHLADKGMIVVATNHPGTTSRDSDQQQTLKIWQRPADLSAMIMFFEKSPPFGLQPDMKKIGAVGFSLGGHSVLGLAGAQVEKQKYVDYCDGNSSKLDCAWYGKAGVKLTSIQKDKFQSSFKDKRLKTVVAIDPGLAQAFNSTSLSTLNLPTLIINLGAKGKVPLGIDGVKLVPLIPNAKHINIEGATHFSFLGECTKIGESIIKSEGEEPICSEVSGRKRSAIHQELKKRIADYLLMQFRN